MKYELLQIVGAVAAVIISTASFVVTYLRIKRELRERERRQLQHQLNEDRKRAERAERHEERQHAHA
ncbi:MAG: hypothetical protein QOH88_1746 [Verrucomicrobiota bacterium]